MQETYLVAVEATHRRSGRDRAADDLVVWRTVDALGLIAHPRVRMVDDYPFGADALRLSYWTRTCSE
jgi:hypothetical protein